MSINGEIDPSKAPVLAHLRELRKRVFKSALGVLLLAIVGWVFYNQIILKLAQPICGMNGELNDLKECTSLYVSGVLGPLNLQIKVALLVGVILAAPIWLYQIWAFVAPALSKKEKRNSVFFIIAATPFFAAGAYLAFYILPMAIRVLFGFTPEALGNLVRFDDYLDFVLRLIIVFGLAFELPVFLVSLNLVGVLSGKSILRPWRFAIFGITFFVAAFSPTADPLSMAALALPLIALYFGAGGIAILVDKRRDRRKSKISIDEAAPIDRPESI